MEINAGASALDLRNLANAAFVELRLEGGAASYRLDFAGHVRRNARAQVSAGMASLDIEVPSRLSP